MADSACLFQSGVPFRFERRPLRDDLHPIAQRLGLPFLPVGKSEASKAHRSYGLSKTVAMLEASALVATAATALLLTKTYVSDRRCPPKTHLEIEQKIFQCWRECFPHARRFAYFRQGPAGDIQPRR
jgi:hypothetical protein